MHARTRCRLVVAVSVLLVGMSSAAAPALAPLFTYQGQLRQDGNLINGTCDFQFRLFDAPTGGTQVGSPQYADDVVVADGLVSLQLGFDSALFTGDDRYLEIRVRCPDGSGGYTTLDPRQMLTAAPYAFYAPSAGNAADLSCTGCVDASALASGAVTSSKIAAGTIQPSNLAFSTVTSVNAGSGLLGGTITGSGTIDVEFGTTAGTVAAGNHAHDPLYWQTTGNSGTMVGGNFLGTTDNSALDVRVNNQRALRLQPGTSPNLIGGWNTNVVRDGAVGAVIAGGGAPDDGSGTPAPNEASDNHAVVSGGMSNFAGTQNGNPADAAYATIGGGDRNIAGAYAATIGGGTGNRVDHAPPAPYGTIAGGRDNVVGADYATVAGGFGNRAGAAYATIGGGGRSDPVDGNTANRVSDDYGTVAGGGNNQVGNANALPADATYATVGGGGGNTASAQGATVGGGGGNRASGNYATVAGGVFSAADGEHATVPGGAGNFASGPGSFAAGRLSAASHAGSFVWGDGTRIAASQGPNTFNVLATGGMRFYFDTLGNHCDLTSTANWTCSTVSDRTVKSDVRSVDGRAILDRVAALPIQRWRYTSQTPRSEHIGPMAQDFYAAFQVGEDDTHINTVDADGVALAAIQGLYQRVREQEAQIAEQRQMIRTLQDLNAQLQRRMMAGEQRIAAIAARWLPTAAQIAAGSESTR